MSAACCHHAPAPAPVDPRYRRALWVALAVNAIMFAVEIGAGVKAESASLVADAIDFAGDAANYAVSLFVLSMAVAWRSRVALAKGWTMGLYGAFVLGLAAWNAWQGVRPEPVTMGVIGGMALAANLGVALLLYRFKDGDANMQSVWLCTRNDAIGNLAILLAAVGVFGTGTGWPDFIVAAIMGTLAVSAAFTVVRGARIELRAGSLARPACDA